MNCKSVAISSVLSKTLPLFLVTWIAYQGGCKPIYNTPKVSSSNSQSAEDLSAKEKLKRKPNETLDKYIHRLSMLSSQEENFQEVDIDRFEEEQREFKKKLGTKVLEDLASYRKQLEKEMEEKLKAHSDELVKKSDETLKERRENFRKENLKHDQYMLDILEALEKAMVEKQSTKDKIDLAESKSTNDAIQKIKIQKHSYSAKIGMSSFGSQDHTNLNKVESERPLDDLDEGTSVNP